MSSSNPERVSSFGASEAAGSATAKSSGTPQAQTARAKLLLTMLSGHVRLAAICVSGAISALALLMSTTALAKDAPQPAAKGEPAWLPVEQESLMRRSFVRCFLQRYRAVGIKASEQDAHTAYGLDLDAKSSLITSADVSKAPIESVGGQTYIACAWLGRDVPRPAQ